jgi:hypothetical protein
MHRHEHVRAMIAATTIAACELALVEGQARAQPPPEEPNLAEAPQPLPPPSDAVEIGVGLGYAHAFGHPSTEAPRRVNMGVDGATLALELGWRASPPIEIGVYASGTQLGNAALVPGSADVYAATAGVKLAWHLRPDRGLDPWLGIGLGWSGYWQSFERGGVTALHGVDLARARVGVDYRVREDFALTPLVGVDVTRFVIESLAGERTWRIHPAGFDVFFFAGVAARIDVPLNPPKGGPRISP